MTHLRPSHCWLVVLGLEGCLLLAGPGCSHPAGVLERVIRGDYRGKSHVSADVPAVLKPEEQGRENKTAEASEQFGQERQEYGDIRAIQKSLPRTCLTLASVVSESERVSFSV